MRTGGVARYAAFITTHKDVAALADFAHTQHLPLRIIGEGTNTLFGSNTLDIVLGVMQLQGIAVLEETDASVMLHAAAGERWDDLVAWSVARNLAGLEALSSIPGTVGAAPIQNIGAYGAEFKDVCVSVTIYDTVTCEVRELPREACSFTYRDSIFKQQPNAYIVLGVTIALSKKPPTLPAYKDVLEYFEDRPTVSVHDIREAIITIRDRKLPDYTTIPNLGSFFKNPIIDAAAFAAIVAQHTGLPHAVLPDGRVKLFAGWLIEQCGYKGATVAGLTVYEKNALVLTNPNHLPYESVRAAEEAIRTTVHERFGVTLEREPVCIG
jgi:UDP-N-acetylmuramate dehydrogenase